MSLIERVRARCIEEGDCWIWQGGCSGAQAAKCPQISYLGQKVYVRRAIWEDTWGRKVSKNKLITTTCQTPLCVCPDHITSMTHSELGARAGGQGKFSTLSRRAKISAAKRATAAKLTVEQAQEIRASEQPIDAIAAAFGVHRSLVLGIRRGDRWREYSSPFAGLMG